MGGNSLQRLMATQSSFLLQATALITQCMMAATVMFGVLRHILHTLTVLGVCTFIQVIAV